MHASWDLTFLLHLSCYQVIEPPEGECLIWYLLLDNEFVISVFKTYCARLASFSARAECSLDCLWEREAVDLNDGVNVWVWECVCVCVWGTGGRGETAERQWWRRKETVREEETSRMVTPTSPSFFSVSSKKWQQSALWKTTRGWRSHEDPCGYFFRGPR